MIGRSLVVSILFLSLFLLSIASNEVPAKIEPTIFPTNQPTITSSPTVTVQLPLPQVLAQTNTNVVSRIIDGDTFVIENGQTVRLIGIDTPELHHPRIPKECFAREAFEALSKLVLGKPIFLEKDISETDRYGRFLRFAYVGNLFINDYLVKQGYATVATFPPDVKYAERFRQGQIEARENQRGLWSHCQYKSGNEKILPTVNQNPPDGSCQIKGNISSSGEKIYHLPSQKYYDKTVIDEGRGERWFCNDIEAQSSGWRKAKQ